MRGYLLPMQAEPKKVLKTKLVTGSPFHVSGAIAVRQCLSSSVIPVPKRRHVASRCESTTAMLPKRSSLSALPPAAANEHTVVSIPLLLQPCHHNKFALSRISPESTDGWVIERNALIRPGRKLIHGHSGGYAPARHDEDFDLRGSETSGDREEGVMWVQSRYDAGMSKNYNKSCRRMTDSMGCRAGLVRQTEVITETSDLIASTRRTPMEFSHTPATLIVVLCSFPAS